jgi:chemotaxis protein CheX
MSTNEQIIKIMVDAASNVFSTMLGSELGPGEASIEHGMPDVSDGIVSFIGLAGAWAGTGSIQCSPTAACRVCSLMLMVDSTSVDADVLDAVAELTNMVIGSAKNDLEPQMGPLGLSIPTVVFGKNFRTKSAGSTDWIVVKFPWEGETIAVKLFLAPTERLPHATTHMMGQTCPLEV